MMTGTVQRVYLTRSLSQHHHGPNIAEFGVHHHIYMISMEDMVRSILEGSLQISVTLTCKMSLRCQVVSKGKVYLFESTECCIYSQGALGLRNSERRFRLDILPSKVNP